MWQRQPYCEIASNWKSLRLAGDAAMCKRMCDIDQSSELAECERLGRKCRACEISPGYVAVALERYFQVTGETPFLQQGNNTE